MSFKNEFVPLLDQEHSEFFRKVRKSLHTGFTTYDCWTVDRERDMVLFHEGSGHDIESASYDLWAYIDRKGHYVFGTDRLSRTEGPAQSLVISYRLRGFWGGNRYSTPDAATLASIKEALRESSRWYLSNPEAFTRCELTLVDGSTGQEL